MGHRLAALLAALALGGAGPATAQDPPAAALTMVTPHWAIRALSSDDGFQRCEAVAFERDRATELSMRIYANGAFSLGLASTEDLVPPGLTREATLEVAGRVGEPWQFPADLVGEPGGVIVVSDDVFALAFAMIRGWRIVIPAGGLRFTFPLTGVTRALPALERCAEFYGVPTISLPPLPEPAPEPAEDGGS